MSCSVHLAVWWGCRTIVADQERLDRTLVGVQHRGPSTLEPPQNVKKMTKAVEVMTKITGTVIATAKVLLVRGATRF